MNHLFLRVRNVSKTYFAHGKPFKEALKGISLDIHSGEVLGLLGVNGAGKTTLSSILATLHPPTSGELLWQGVSVYKDLFNFRKSIGYCPQNPNIEKNFSLEQNLLTMGRCYGLTPTQTQERTDRLLTQFQLEPYARAYVSQLSGGYRQRFLIARALVHEPAFVILDEPTVGLDPHIRREIWEVIRSLQAQNVTVLLTTHYLDEAETLSDRVCLIHGGTVRTIDTPDNLKRFHQKNNLEEVFLKFVDDPEAEFFNSVGTHLDA